MKPGTITSTLVAIVVVLQLISLAAVTQANRARQYNQTKLLAVHELDARAKGLVVQIQQFLAPITSQLTISRQLFADGLLKTENNAVLERYFLSQLRANLGMDSMYLGRYDGSFVAVTRFENSLVSGYDKPVFLAKISSVTHDNVRVVEWREYSHLGEELNQWTEEADVYDPRQREWYINAQMHDKPVWTNAYSSTDNQKLNIAASVNLRDKANVDAGVLGVSVDLTQLSTLLTTIPSNKKASLFLFDDSFNQIVPAMSKSSQSRTNVHRNSIRSIWNERDFNDRPERFLPPIDTPGNRYSNLERHWYSNNDTQANVLRRIQLFDGALHWRILLQTPLTAPENIQKSVMFDDMYPTMLIIVLPGALALLVILGLKTPLQRLHNRATIDYLTKAWNREEFLNRFSKRLDRARRRSGKSQWVAVALDLDRFKQINDQFGHHAGDDILKEVVIRLQQKVGRPGFVGRLGGDEFAIALKLPPGIDARIAVERIRRFVVSMPINSAQAQHHIGMTAGIAIVREDENATAVLDRADHALVTGKAIAKNTTYRSTGIDEENGLSTTRAFKDSDKPVFVQFGGAAQAELIRQ
ncbi:MAG: diguanylate cyclase [Granulosicoccus sp.]